MQIPSQIAGVISVAATGHNGLKAYYSNFGLKFVNVRESSLETIHDWRMFSWQESCISVSIPEQLIPYIVINYFHHSLVRS